MDTKHIVSDLKSLKKEHMISEIKTAFDVALFKKNVMAHVAGDAQKTKFGYYIIAVGAILGFLGMQLFGGWFRPALVPGLINMVIQAVMAVVGIYVLSYVAQKIFKGAAAHDHFFRVAAYAMILTWASIMPAIGMLIGIWSLALIFVILKTIHKLSTGGAIGALIVTAIAYMVVGTILATLGLGAGMMGGGSFSGSSSRGLGSFNFGSGKDSGSIDFSNGGMKIKTSEGEVNFTMPNIK